ncbi:MAG: SDR family oxidoreductase, partial [Pseudomonadota bacterium]
MNTYDFTDRVAVVTGGAQGIGGTVAKAFSDGGAKVALWDLDRTLADRHAEAIGGQAFSCDVADFASVESAHKATVEAFG